MQDIRRASSDDFDQVFTLLQQLWPDARLDAAALARTFAQVLAAPTKHMYCAVEGGRVVGFISLDVRGNLWQAGPLAHVDELVVDRACRGRGLGTALLRHVMAVAAKMGCRRVELDSAFHRSDAHRFYERAGFEKRAYVFSRRLSDTEI